ncbi:MAG: Pr2TM family membrane protein [Alphaproteobacteria bacterium]|jgi:hypothetical protein|nr:Pr2TM family membrane protein [Alphaproteobacteria bacterium]
MATSNESHLATVLSVDVAEVSEDGLKRVREAFTSAVDHHGGTTAPEQADGLRAEFKGASDAVASALSMLDAVDDGNVEAADDDAAVVRAGIALGVITTTDEAIVGAGVEMADDLRDLAVSGGLRISAAIYEQARGRTKNGFELLGEYSVDGEETGVYGFDPDEENAPENPRITFQNHRREFRAHRREFREHRKSFRRHGPSRPAATPEDRAKYAVARMKKLYRGVYVGGATIAFLFMVNVLGSGIDWWFAWPSFFIVAALGLVSFRTLGSDGMREVGERVRGWFSNRSSWVDRREAQIRAQLEAAGKTDDGRVARRMKAFHAFRSRARSFAGVTGVLFVINVLTSAGDWWFLWPGVVMAYVLALSALKVFGLDSVLGDDWEDRKRRELVAQFERERETA